MTGSWIQRQDLDFLLFHWLDVEALSCERFPDVSRETVTALLDLSDTVAARYFAPHYKAADTHEPRLQDGQVHVLPAIGEALARYAEAGLFGQSFSPEHGGLGLPLSVAAASFAHVLAANIATAAYPMLTVANARLLVTFASEQLVEAFALPQIEGRYLGTMCLSEPQAGSSLADITTRAVPDGSDGLGARYRLFGNKMWISGGDQDISANICHLVLAKIPDEGGRLVPGTAGISLFLVPKVLVAPGDFAGERNDVTVAGLNHKMGYRGTANCLLHFGEGGTDRPGGSAGAVGYLVGTAGGGLPIMFSMMNEARLQVGLGAAMLAYRAHRQSVSYSRERTQGRPRGALATSPPVPLVAHADVRRMLLAQKAYAEGALSLLLYCFVLADSIEVGGGVEDRSLLDLLTPIAKTWSSEWGLTANDLAIQIHGGYGYTRDFDVEQLWRDNRLNPIHEGTTGIQALDLVGRKLVRDNGATLSTLLSRMDATIARTAVVDELAAAAEALASTRSTVEHTLRAMIAAPTESCALDNATAILQALGHLVVGWLWLDQAAAALCNRELLPGDLVQGKLAAARFFALRELPKIAAMLAGAVAAPSLYRDIPDSVF